MLFTFTPPVKMSQEASQSVEKVVSLQQANDTKAMFDW